ncbi:lamin-C-like isoform X2 [Tachypleus tridentatus]
MEIEETDAQKKYQYERKLAEALQKLREQYEKQIKMNREEFETVYVMKVSDLQKLLDINSSLVSSTREEVRKYRSDSEILSSKAEDLCSVCLICREILQIRFQLSLTDAFGPLMLIMSLIGFINVLNISCNKSRTDKSGQSISGHSSSFQGVKRKHSIAKKQSSTTIHVTASAKGDIEITDQDKERKYIKIHNKGDQVS